MDTIRKFGKDLCSINMLTVLRPQKICFRHFLDHISEGCPKLKTLTLESLRGWKEMPFNYRYVEDDFEDDDSDDWDLIISVESLEGLHNRCKELKDVKLTHVWFDHIFTEDDMKQFLPNCNVELKECGFDDFDELVKLHDREFKLMNGIDLSESDDSELWSDGYDSDNTWDVSLDDGEQDSNSEGADESDETNDILDDFDGEEIDLMFSENYGEELSVRGRMVKHRSSYLCTYLIKNLLFFSYISTETNNFTSRRPPGLCTASSYDGDRTESNDWIFSKN